MAPFVSIVVVNWNSAALLARGLRSIATTTWPDWECIVVDNASTDESRQVVRERFPWARLVASPENLGPGNGYNLGADHARGQVIAFLNEDVVVTPGWLSTLMGRLEELPDVGVMFPTIVQPIDLLGVRDPTEAEIAAWASHPEPEVEEVAAMQSATMLVRREVFDTLGGFNRRIFVAHEDAEFCWRAWLAGWRVVKVHEAVAFHLEMGHSGWTRRTPEQIRNGLYVNLRLMEWPVVARVAGRMAGKTVVRGVRLRQPAVLGAWSDTAVALPRILRERRAELAGVPPERRARLARLVAHHAAWQRHRRRQRILLGALTALERRAPVALQPALTRQVARVGTLTGPPQPSDA